MCLYISLRDAALATIRVLKTGCYCSQNAALQIAQNGGGWGAGGWLTGFSQAGELEFPPSCGSGPVAVGSGLWGRSQSAEVEGGAFQHARCVLLVDI